MAHPLTSTSVTAVDVRTDGGILRRRSRVARATASLSAELNSPAKRRNCDLARNVTGMAPDATQTQDAIHLDFGWTRYIVVLTDAIHREESIRRNSMSSNSSWGRKSHGTRDAVGRVRKALATRGGERSYPTHPHIEHPHERVRFQPPPVA